MRIMSEVFKSPEQIVNPALREVAKKPHLMREVGYATICAKLAADLERDKGAVLNVSDAKYGTFGYCAQEVVRTMTVLVESTASKTDANNRALNMIAKSVKEFLFETGDKSAVAAEKLLLTASVFAEAVESKPPRVKAPRVKAPPKPPKAKKDKPQSERFNIVSGDPGVPKARKPRKAKKAKKASDEEAVLKIKFDGDPGVIKADAILKATEPTP